MTDTPRPTCNTWDPARCTAPAVAVLLAPDGARVPGGRVCWDHGAAILGEYAAKLGQQWGAEQIAGRAEA